MIIQTLATALATVTVGGFATVATLTGVGSSDSTDSSTAPDGDLLVPCGVVWDRLPAELQDDLRALREHPFGERRSAAMDIRRQALAGEYGERVQQFAEHRREIRGRIWPQLPAELREDITAARSLPSEEREAAYQAIRDKALAGEYGEQVQEVAERIQHRREVCD